MYIDNYLNVETFVKKFFDLFLQNSFYSNVSFYILDKNECTESDTCQNGVCRNLKGSFQCSCNDGYVETKDKKGCIGMFTILFLLKYDYENCQNFKIIC